MAAISSGDVVRDRNDVECRDATDIRRRRLARLTPTPSVLRQRWRVPARQLRQWPQVMCPSPETRSPIFEAAHLAADLDDLADKFVADDHRHRNGLLRPLVPVPDVDVGAADRRLADPDQHVVGADLGSAPASSSHPQAQAPASPLTSARIRSGLSSNAPRARARPLGEGRDRPVESARCMRRATSGCGCAPCPCGTTGKEKPIT